MTQKNVEKLERKNRRKPAMPAPMREKTKKERIEAARKKYRKEDV